MPRRPFFTVAIPTFNRASFLAEAVRGVLDQSFADFELLIGDNHSEDDTPDVVASFDDPRIRYFRHDENLGPLPNAIFLERRKSGSLFVFHQDDDLIHRDFLARSADALRRHDAAVMYACGRWRGNLAEGFSARVLPLPELPDFGFLATDELQVLDGPPLAVSLLHADYFAHPALVMRSSVLDEIGGYHAVCESAADKITQARMLCRGPLVLDPWVGTVFRNHAGNLPRTLGRTYRHLRVRNTYRQMLDDFEVQGIDWPGILRDDLERLPTDLVLKCFREWVRYKAPRRLQRFGWRQLRRRLSARRILLKLGVRKSTGFVRAQLAAETPVTGADERIPSAST